MEYSSDGGLVTHINVAQLLHTVLCTTARLLGSCTKSRRVVQNSLTSACPDRLNYAMLTCHVVCSICSHCYHAIWLYQPGVIQVFAAPVAPLAHKLAQLGVIVVTSSGSIRLVLFGCLPRTSCTTRARGRPARSHCHHIIWLYQTSVIRVSAAHQLHHSRTSSPSSESLSSHHLALSD